MTIYLTAKPVLGRRLVARRSSQAPWRAPATMPAARVAVYAHLVGEPAESAQLVGIYARGAAGVLPFTPLRDQQVVLRPISIGADGTMEYERISDAPAVVVNYTRPKDYFAANFGDGSSNSFMITHGLESEDLQVEFRYAGGSKESVSGIVWAPDASDPTNKIVLTTTVAPGANELRVIVKK